MNPDRILHIVAGMTPGERADFVMRLSDSEVTALHQLLPAAGDQLIEWDLYPHQIPPDDFAARQMFGWFLMAGRGAGKTLAGASWLDEQARERSGTRWGIIAPTLPDARQLCVHGPTGLLAVNPSIRFNESKYELHWPNGSYAEIRGAYTPQDRQRLRGRQWHGAWCEEYASWRQLDERPDPDDPDAWQAVEIACRLGEFPQAVITSTPKRRARVRELLNRHDVVVIHAEMGDNPNLPDAYRQRLLERFGGTRLARQELKGQLLEDVEGANWTEQVLSDHRVHVAPELGTIVIGVDPPAETAECGIVAVGLSQERHPHPQTGRPVRHGYVIADVSHEGTPERWGKTVVDLYHDLAADRVVGEVNNGGDMVRAVVHGIDDTVNFDKVRASRSKHVRAEPVASQYAQGLWHHVGRYPELEDEQTTYRDGDGWSPNRMDALVWACTAVLDKISQQPAKVGRARDYSAPGILGRQARGL